MSILIEAIDKMDITLNVTKVLYAILHETKMNGTALNDTVFSETTLKDTTIHDIILN